ncbi:hypothetical protein L402_00274 [Enterobacter asburiae]|uniref:Biofilm-associated protein BapA-like prefix-like domain-containing protein n=1 Tax=Enterobacter asburiae TaxID=61645 RepID=A0ABC9UGH8_ENTAS|nr:hypothetical protein L402_00274 [Enterobacter asburiae]
MSQISVISKLTGVETTTEGTQVTLSHSSIVELHVERASVSDLDPPFPDSFCILS